MVSMLLRPSFCVALVYGFISTTRAVPSALPGDRVHLAPRALATMLARAEMNIANSSSRPQVEFQKNTGPAQIPFIFCPEVFNEPPHSCSVCGGESDSMPGKCKSPNKGGYICNCRFSFAFDGTTNHRCGIVGHATRLADCLNRLQYWKKWINNSGDHNYCKWANCDWHLRVGYHYSICEPQTAYHYHYYYYAFSHCKWRFRSADSRGRCACGGCSMALSR